MALGSLVLAVKYNEDNYYDANYYSRVGGISAAELNFIEIEIASMMKFELHVSSDTYECYLKEILRTSITISNISEENRPTVPIEDTKEELKSNAENKKEEVKENIENVKTVPSMDDIKSAK